ncbi:MULTISPECIES: hypothetical protein [Streptomyces]|uniref:hypothetical protein n=1 Tax=Streptomyces TaxID=1883 RepID=UPI00345BD86B
MQDYLTALDTAPEPVPADRRVLAAIGPKMLRLAGDRAAGAIPYLVTPEFTAQARTALGDQPFLGPEMKAVLDTDQARARATARDYLTGYLTLPNYTNNLLRSGSPGRRRGAEPARGRGRELTSGRGPHKSGSYRFRGP